MYDKCAQPQYVMTCGDVACFAGSYATKHSKCFKSCTWATTCCGCVLFEWWCTVADAKVVRYRLTRANDTVACQNSGVELLAEGLQHNRSLVLKCSCANICLSDAALLMFEAS